MEKGKNGLSEELRRVVIGQDKQLIPEYFDSCDVRKPVKLYVDDKLREILDDVFEIRRKLEKTFSRNELLAYDRVLIRHLTLENLIPRLR